MPDAAPQPAHEDQFERDPVSGERVHVQTAAHVDLGGRLYYFASVDNQEAFLDDPERYLTDEVTNRAARAAPQEDGAANA